MAEGVAIAEFPTTRDAARVSHTNGLIIMRSAPNLTRGGSHSRNVATETLARKGVLDILFLDDVPASLLMATFDLPRRVRMTGGVPVMRQVWRQGRRVA
jgi:alpha-D-ribose 1-methylphosphonate 5-triphosphate diphosphatase